MLLFETVKGTRNLGEVWATPKLLSLGIKKMGKETPGIISNGFFWKPGQLSIKHTKRFPEIFFRLGAEVEIPKMAIFRRCLEIAGKAENGGKFLGANPKKIILLT